MKGYIWPVVVLFFLFGEVAFSLTLQVDLREEVELRAGRLTLGDIATVSYPDVQWEERIRKIDLGYLPPPGEIRVVKPQEIYERVVSKNIPGLDYIYFQGSDLCRVVITGQKIDREALKARLVKELRERFFPEAQEIEVDILGSGDNLIVTEEGSFDLELPSSVKPWGMSKGKIREPGSGEPIPFTFTVQVYRGVLRTTREMLPQETVQEGDVVLRVEALSPENEKALSSLESVLGRKVKKKLGAGTIVTEAVLAREALIRRGDLVTIVAQKGGIVITTLGKSRGDGSLGDVIVVENLTSHKRMEAEVIGERMVQVRVK
ncbi:MAG: flagellar basal body P-ring formation chaperone FlgA [Candidatus Caldatribacteriaceae bacterium]